MARKIEIVLATRNKKKQKEIVSILKGLPIKLFSLDNFPSMPPVRENAFTFKGNAVKKAQAAAKFTSRLALADDSGLEVKALGGRPGVFSARYAGKQVTYRANNQKLLKELKGVPFSRRRAAFRCSVVLASPRKIIEVAEGECSGYILTRLRGRRGFGYDPLFYYPPYKKTFAELLPSEKNKLSHRCRALKKMAKVIKTLVK
ncbi:MAG: XTP/dITP diphosphatase [Candidatus Ratteibacteria bacterium]|nr:XTP/dITP diphosphatase [Candidatus Ratteibacteria bacterium]